MRGKHLNRQRMPECMAECSLRCITEWHREDIRLGDASETATHSAISPTQHITKQLAYK